MTKRNVHGLWTISFEERILHTKVTGATNTETGQVWLEEMQELLFSSQGSDSLPWVVLNDCRHWDTCSLDAWDYYNEMITWMSEHHCIFYAFVFSNKIQGFAAEKWFDANDILNYFFDYEEAHQACLNALAKANNEQ
ncbi:hypothetical protein L4C34_18335 [Vibrio profundum]|uniref:hypothetical protein n=1 Tax=Vibrio profundum TaxID=2910247 RepID=UPI003D14C196